MVALLAVAPLAGCAGAAVYGGVEGASVAVFGRGLLDIGVSAVTGRDCSIVRLDRQQPYCAPRDRLPDAPPFCTRTLGRVECWADPERFTTLPRQVAGRTRRSPWTRPGRSPRAGRRR